MKDQRKVTIIAVILLVIIAGVFLYFKNHPIKSNIHRPVVVAKLPVINPLPASADGLSEDGKKAYEERKAWKAAAVGNQPTLSTAQSLALPDGFMAREDYLLTVVSPSMSTNILNYRAVIIRPIKPLSREDAIFTVPDVSEFKDHCHITAGQSGVCYGGTNPLTKHAFDLMFYDFKVQ